MKLCSALCVALVELLAIVRLLLALFRLRARSFVVNDLLHVTTFEVLHLVLEEFGNGLLVQKANLLN